MLVRVTVLLLVVLSLASCKKAAVKPETTEGGGTDQALQQDTSVTNKDLSFDPQGSDSGKIEGLYTIHFDFDKSALTTEARDLLAKNYDWMKKNDSATIQIEGHCDSKGSIEYNLALGERRAKAVKQYMAQLGAPSDRMSVISYGKEKPLDGSGTDAGDAKNRRANFVIISR